VVVEAPDQRAAVSVRHALVGALVREKSCVVVPPSVTTIDEVVRETH